MRCKATIEIEDPVCVMYHQCVLEEGHAVGHQAIYPGVEGDIEMPIYWCDENVKVEFERPANGSRRDNQLVVKWSKRDDD